MTLSKDKDRHKEKGRQIEESPEPSAPEVAEPAVEPEAADEAAALPSGLPWAAWASSAPCAWIMPGWFLLCAIQLPWLPTCSKNGRLEG